MRKTALKPGKPLQRKTRLRPRKSLQRRRPATNDPAYLAKVRMLPCAAKGMEWRSEWVCADGSPALAVWTHECRAPRHAHHATYARNGQRKALDRYALPLCASAHRMFHDLRGPFSGFTKATRRSWEIDAVAATQAAVGAMDLPDEQRVRGARRTGGLW